MYIYAYVSYIYIYVCLCVCLYVYRTKKQRMYSFVKFYEKDNGIHEIYFTVRLGEFKGGKHSLWKFKYFRFQWK